MKPANLPTIGRWIMLAFVAWLGTVAAAAAADVDSGAAAFERFTFLAGRWTGGEGEATYAMELAVIAGGKTVVAREFPGTDHEMTTLYYLRDGELVGQHYCMLGNQPRYRHQPTADASEVRFVFDGGDNLDPARDAHAHEGYLRLRADGTLESTWSFWKDGGESGTESFVMRRVD
ncbi:MAG TPA: hypothetical protein VNB06_20500 [Thermoanaerobaculia bacterium]|nr:hypothetical protein [Thermoanaerobaculia bacterium]